MDNLPRDLVYEILLHLPATTLGNAARHVCRSWRSIVSDPTFVDHHTRSVSDEDAKILLFQKGMFNYNEGLVMYSTEGGMEPIRPKHQFPVDMTLDNTKNLVCNGLVLYIYRKGGVLNFYLSNPILNQSINLPPMRSRINGTKYCTSGFGYDSITKEYKVVLVFNNLGEKVVTTSYFYCCTINPRTETKDPNYCWREVCSVDQETSRCDGLFVNGTLQWLLFPPIFEAKILSFDLSTESLNLATFSTRDEPRFLGHKFLSELNGGKLCVHVSHDEGRDWSTVWVKKDEEDMNGSENSNWVEESDLRNIQFLPNYCGPWKKDLFVYDGEGESYVVMDKRNVVVEVVDFGGFFLSTFVPTLVSLSATRSPTQHQNGDAEDMDLD